MSLSGCGNIVSSGNTKVTISPELRGTFDDRVNLNEFSAPLTTEVGSTAKLSIYHSSVMVRTTLKPRSISLKPLMSKVTTTISAVGALLRGFYTPVIRMVVKSPASILFLD